MCQCTFKAKQDERKYMFIAKIDNQGLYSDSIPIDQLANKLIKYTCTLLSKLDQIRCNVIVINYKNE